MTSGRNRPALGSSESRFPHTHWLQGTENFVGIGSDIRNLTAYRRAPPGDDSGADLYSVDRHRLHLATARLRLFRHREAVRRRTGARPGHEAAHRTRAVRFRRSQIAERRRGNRPRIGDDT